VSYAECRYTECRYAECLGVKKMGGGYAVISNVEAKKWQLYLNGTYIDLQTENTASSEFGQSKSF
jgi:hypothetical protein